MEAGADGACLPGAGSSERMTSRDSRPVALNLFRIRFPAPAVVSILHRLSGLLLFLGIPVAVYLMEQSLADARGFARVQGLLATPALRLFGLSVAWAFSHHLLAGLRYLLIDLGIGVDRAGARAGAWVVGVAAAAVAVAYLACLGGLW
ncbi:succinate dehydrogenase cytochrome b556 subunit [bacterium BMS3Bbin12]|nr:succinate dehydrogenase cytochrome b556 subunit [bacterium BMS3Abin12]GBE47566.1 succinate dehydrogenase cytochrome b556 subunit [bacterium BMS3Bbin12]GBE50995.1 succinate dehydrogenase cytochrome b556 subunit [bacterium BMS3Bbin13]